MPVTRIAAVGIAALIVVGAGCSSDSKSSENTSADTSGLHKETLP